MENKDERPLQDIFTDVPPKYDLINRLFTLRMDERWRKKAVRECLKGEPDKILDLCCGTGDLALRMARQANWDCEITGVDFSPTMLELARQKLKKQGGREVGFIFGDVADLPFETDSFDTAGISFAFRNLTFENPDTPKFLAEIYRVVRPGGKFVIVESSQPKNKLYRKFQHGYMKHVVRNMGALISGNRKAYQYFYYSVSNYYTAEQLKQLLLDTGFSSADYIPLAGGAAAVHIAVK
jgi:demethylmenaquinone methyltransferase/2-methoxy-6-polyprenyl-1,4-benzoquinol methylase